MSCRIVCVNSASGACSTSSARGSTRLLEVELALQAAGRRMIDGAGVLEPAQHVSLRADELQLERLERGSPAVAVRRFRLVLELRGVPLDPRGEDPAQRL